MSALARRGENLTAVREFAPLPHSLSPVAAGRKSRLPKTTVQPVAAPSAATRYPACLDRGTGALR